MTRCRDPIAAGDSMVGNQFREHGFEYVNVCAPKQPNAQFFARDSVGERIRPVMWAGIVMMTLVAGVLIYFGWWTKAAVAAGVGIGMIVLAQTLPDYGGTIVLGGLGVFALAHFTLGQPLLLIGVAVISLVIGFTFYRTKNVLPGVVAHGVFDAVQLFVIIPIAFKVAGL